MVANKLHVALDTFFNDLRNDGITAIALSDNEEVRTRLLGVMQYVTRTEIELKQLISELESNIVLSDGSGVDVSQLANTEGDITIVTIGEHD
jgi:hypothetical protein